jgi:hypothetical protein
MTTYRSRVGRGRLLVRGAAMRGTDPPRSDPMPPDADRPFTADDLDRLAEVAVAAWREGLDRDWSTPAGTLEWSCRRTADHAVDAVLAVGLFLAARKDDGYPDWGWGELTMGPSARPADLVEGLATVARVLSAVVRASPPDVRAVIWRRPRLEVRGPVDFAPRGGLELVLHAHDVAAGLGVPFAPPAEVCARLRDHTRDWPHWRSPGWCPPPTTDDPWHDLLVGSGRARETPSQEGSSR